jgi:dipeptidyl aminopeptidase/acylaminoacyl peptidase
MNETRELLERVGDRFAFPAEAFERLENRRDRKRRNQRIAAGIVGVAVAVAVAVAGASLIRSSSRPATPSPSPDLPPILRSGEILGGHDLNGAGSLVAVDSATGKERTLAECVGPCELFRGYAASPDGRWLAYEVWTCVGGPQCESNAGIWVVNALGQEKQLTRSCRQDACHAETWAWSPLGATLAVGTSGDTPGLDTPALVTLDPQTRKRTQIADGGDVSALAWSPDGTKIAYAAGSAIEVADLETGRSTSLAGAVGGVDTIAWSPDGTRLVVDASSGGQRIIVLAADGSDQRTIVDETSKEGPVAPAWSPDGSRIAYISTPREQGSGGFSLEVWVIGADGSNPTRVFAGACCIQDWDGPIWSPDGERVAFWGDADTPYDRWLVVNADGSGQPQEITDVEAKNWRPDEIPAT